jgi:hypothetical protein
MTNFPNAAWDVMGGPCGFRYNVVWSAVQGCFAGDTTLALAVFIVADAYGIYHLIDDITVNGKTFSSAADNSNGNNDPAGPTLTTDPSLLPPILPLVQPRGHSWDSRAAPSARWTLAPTVALPSKPALCKRPQISCLPIVAAKAQMMLGLLMIWAVVEWTRPVSRSFANWLMARELFAQRVETSALPMQLSPQHSAGVLTNPTWSWRHSGDGGLAAAEDHGSDPSVGIRQDARAGTF